MNFRCFARRFFSLFFQKEAVDVDEGEITAADRKKEREREGERE